MARTSVTTQVITRAGLAPNLTGPVADGDIIDSGACWLHVLNGSGAPITVTVQTPVTVDGLPLDDLEVAVPASGTRLIGPFPARTFAQASDAPVGAGRVLVDYSSVTSVTRAVVSL
ncbi:MAG TPA: hypothetical protein VGD67_13780 [Pseudonocardiaceae bacterium]